ncbi:hypothetical protein DFO77_10441 [Marinilabilia salmonicolor]|jgi:hypothetical protein|uniref:Uncharacterized protein n=1 Tax=Marinilabilia salmonicolor TaxID=989 RepID=A0A2T0XMP2_9BACT|nr:hypothetical protein BY457_10643 [Marinilabilia salmonicolor]RCW38284.1 hypothetical protein DFO77_10441 [Marinilabilia salmonicolor]
MGVDARIGHERAPDNASRNPNPKKPESINCRGC